MKRVVIAGGGITGLALALALRRRGIEPLVLEASARAGGKIATDREAGFLLEHGPQSFDASDPSAAPLVDEVGLRGSLVPSTGAASRRCVLHDDRLGVVPASPVELLKSELLPALAKFRLALDLVLPRGPSGLGAEESVAAFGRRRFGSRASELLFYPTVSSLYAGIPEAASLPATFPWLAYLERERRTVLIALSRRLRAQERLATFREGMGALPLAMAGRLGASLRLGSTVIGLSRTPHGWRASIRHPDAVEDVDADAIVLALPAYAASEIVEELDRELAATLRDIRYAPVVVAHLGYREEAVPGLPHAYGFYTPPASRSDLLGAVFASRVFPGHAPEGQALVSCRLGGLRDPSRIEESDEAIRWASHEALERLIGARGGPIFFRAVRHVRALPQYLLGHARKIAAIDAMLGRLPGLFLAGSAYRGPGILDCLREAERTAARVESFLA